MPAKKPAKKKAKKPVQCHPDDYNKMVKKHGKPTRQKTHGPDILILYYE